MLTHDDLEFLLGRLPGLRIGVLGDLFLDRYLDLDPALTEPSIETGLDAYQVVRVRSSPGAAGTVINNLVALGVGAVHPVAVIGDDGEGYELRQALTAQRGVSLDGVIVSRERRTPTYTKPLVQEAAGPRELNRLDIKNRVPTPAALEADIRAHLERLWEHCDGWIVLDQVSEAECGGVTARVRERLAQLGAANPHLFVLADSRARIGLFRNVALKPNETECRRALGLPDEATPDVVALARRVGRSVFCTRGERGILLVMPGAEPPETVEVPAYPVTGPIDIVGAGDSTSAGIVCGVAGGLAPAQAAAFGNLVASITIRQLGTTGTATPAQVRERWREIAARQGS
jgi:bifunctional ADP-heptose synthase (sugar kinase/adenylyltransferase)